MRRILLTKRSLMGVCLGAAMALMCQGAYAADFEGGSGSSQDPYQIATAQQFDAIREDLGACYVLTEDIDLSEFEEWTPIGAFVPYGEPEEGEEMSETPDPEQAFSGVLDGDGHKITGLSISQPGGMCVGLFGCTAGASLRQFEVWEADVVGGLMSSDVVGYAYDSLIEAVSLQSCSLSADDIGLEEMNTGVNMIGGIVGAGMDTTMRDCMAAAQITVPDGSANVGLIGGGMEDCSFAGNSAVGSITAGNDCYGIGGLFGCGFGADEIADSEAVDLSITAGDNAYLVGGIVGYAGTWEEDAPTWITNDTASVTIALGENASRVGGIIGGGYFFEADQEHPDPTIYSVTGCETSGQISAKSGTDLGNYAGNTELSQVTQVSGDLVVRIEP